MVGSEELGRILLPKQRDERVMLFDGRKVSDLHTEEHADRRSARLLVRLRDAALLESFSNGVTGYLRRLVRRERWLTALPTLRGHY